MFCFLSKSLFRMRYFGSVFSSVNSRCYYALHTTKAYTMKRGVVFYLTEINLVSEKSSVERNIAAVHHSNSPYSTFTATYKVIFIYNILVLLALPERER